MDNKTLHKTVGGFAYEKIDEDGEEQDGSTEK